MTIEKKPKTPIALACASTTVLALLAPSLAQANDNDKGEGNEGL